jgi:hypothetical protein
VSKSFKPPANAGAEKDIEAIQLLREIRDGQQELLSIWRAIFEKIERGNVLGK